MQAIEFETQLENGLIHLPPSYQHWQTGKQVKVIVLVEDIVLQTVKAKPRQPGFLKNQIEMRDDFDAPMTEEELALWYDSPLFPNA